MHHLVSWHPCVRLRIRFYLLIKLSVTHTEVMNELLVLATKLLEPTLKVMSV